MTTAEAGSGDADLAEMPMILGPSFVLASGLIKLSDPATSPGERPSYKLAKLVTVAVLSRFMMDTKLRGNMPRRS
jgi:hypothetical protein